MRLSTSAGATVPLADRTAGTARGPLAPVDREDSGPYGGAMTTSASAHAAASGAEGAVFLPASYDLIWTAVIAVLIVALVWTMVTVLRSSLSDRAKALWVVLALVVPVVSAIAWLVLGADARRPSSRRPDRRRSTGDGRPARRA